MHWFIIFEQNKTILEQNIDLCYLRMNKILKINLYEHIILHFRDAPCFCLGLRSFQFCLLDFLHYLTVLHQSVYFVFYCGKLLETNGNNQL